MTNSQNASAANLKSDKVSINGYDVHYYSNDSKNKKDTLVLVHGLGDEKNSFTQSAKFLTEDYYLILPDLAGSGENNRDANNDYSIRGQVDFLHDFLQKMNLSKYHIAGNSMGGHVSIAYTLAYPETIKSLTLINSPGLKLDDHLVYTGFGEEIKDKEGLQKILDRVFYKPPSLPGPIVNLMIKQINDSRDFLNNNVIPKIKNGKDFDLKDRIHQITVPTLILWGKHDRVVKFNVAEKYDRDIPNSEIKLLENGSHSPQLEIPQEVAEAIHLFIKKKSN